MNKDYSIIIVSQNELNVTDIRPLVYTFESLEPLSSKPVLERLAKDISSKNIAVLQNALPKFYSTASIKRFRSSVMSCLKTM